MQVEPALWDTVTLGSSDAELEPLYREWFDEVKRWLVAFGVPAADSEDVAQEVFVVVRRKLAAFDGRNRFGWLYRIARRTASDYRRRSWFRNLFQRPRDIALDEIRDLRGTPSDELEQQESQRLVHHLLSKIAPKKRTAFVLFELEGYSCEEIAALEGVPVATIYSRVHHARKEFVRRLANFRSAEEK